MRVLPQVCGVPSMSVSPSTLGQKKINAGNKRERNFLFLQICIETIFVKRCQTYK